MDEMERRIHEMHAVRAQHRRNELTQEVARWRITAPTTITSSSNILADLRSITSRKGFLESQLQMPTLTTLKRWYVQLQLLEMCDNHTRWNGCNSNADSPIPGSDLEQPLALVLNQERRCFDLTYFTTSARIGDHKDALFDVSDHALRPAEALAFSTTQNGFTIRVVLFTLDTDPTVVHVRSSQCVRGLDAAIQVLSSDRQADCECLLKCFRVTV